MTRWDAGGIFLFCIGAFTIGSLFCGIAPDQAAQITGLRGMFRTSGGIIGIASMVLVLSLATDQAAALRTMFLVLSVLLLISIPMAMVVPDSAKARRLESIRTEEPFKVA